MPGQVVPPPFLDQDGIDRAMKYVLGNWPKSAPLRAEEREAWLDILCQLRVGELREALARRRDDQSHRPDPYTILGIVMDMRTAARQMAAQSQRERNANKMRDLAKEPSWGGDPEQISSVADARAALLRAKGGATTKH